MSIKVMDVICYAYKTDTDYDVDLNKPLGINQYIFFRANTNTDY